MVTIISLVSPHAIVLSSPGNEPSPLARGLSPPVRGRKAEEAKGETFCWFVRRKKEFDGESARQDTQWASW